MKADRTRDVQQIEHAGYQRHIIFRKPQRFDADGDPLEDDEEDSQADADALEENPFGELKLEGTSVVQTGVSLADKIPLCRTTCTINLGGRPAHAPFALYTILLEESHGDGRRRPPNPTKRKGEPVEDEASVGAISGRPHMDTLWYLRNGVRSSAPSRVDALQLSCSVRITERGLARSWKHIMGEQL